MIAHLPDPLTPELPRSPAFDRDRSGWVLSRYADVAAAYREPALLPVGARKSKETAVPDPVARHSLRARVLAAFSPSRLNDWQARMERIADSLPWGASVNLVEEFAEPWCLAAAEIVTGSDVCDRQRLLSAARVVSAAAAEPLNDDLQEQARNASAELDRYFTDASIPMAGPTFVALSRTVACLLSIGWLALLRHPAELALLRATPERIPAAVEEILRYACLPQSVFRVAAEPVNLCGLAIGEGERVTLRLASANRDPLQFPDPNRFNVARRSGAHLSLGFGPHACVGAALIRMTTIAAMKVFVEKFAGAELCGPVEWQGGDGFRSPALLHVTR